MKKNIINIIINIFMFFSLCFHNYASKNAFARRAIFSFLVTYIYIYIYNILIYIYINFSMCVKNTISNLHVRNISNSQVFSLLFM